MLNSIKVPKSNGRFWSENTRLIVKNFVTVQFVLKSDENLKQFSAKDEVISNKGSLSAHCSKAAHSLILKST